VYQSLGVFLTEVVNLLKIKNKRTNDFRMTALSCKIGRFALFVARQNFTIIEDEGIGY
jgi:hypothetical protein